MSGVYASYPANGGGGGVTTLGPVGNAPNANGGLISGTTLTLEPADATHPGVLTAADWNTFNNKQATITIGALDAQAANATGLALVANVLSTQSADATHPGVVNTTTQTFAGNKTLSGTTTTAAIVPSTTATYGFGTALATWFNGYINSLFTSRVQSTGTDDLTIATNAGNIYLAPSSTKHAIYQDGSQGTSGQALISSDVNGTFGFAALNLANASAVTGLLPSANLANTAVASLSGTNTGDQSVETLTDVVVTSVAVDDILSWNGADWVNAPPTRLGVAGGISYYQSTPTITATGTSNTLVINTFGITPVTTTTQTIATALTSGGGITALSAWKYPNALNRTTLDAGTYNFNEVAGVSASGHITTITSNICQIQPTASGTVTVTGSGTTRTVTASANTPFAATGFFAASATKNVASYLQTPLGLYQISVRTSDTVVTIVTPSGYVNESAVTYSVWNTLFGASSGNITGVTPAYQINQYMSTQPSFTVAATDLFGKILFGTVNSNLTLTFAYNGTATSSFVGTPWLTLHNDLGGLQGGASQQDFHLTSAEYTRLQLTTSSNTNNAPVLRDGSGNFSAGTITAALTGNATTATTATTATNIAGGAGGSIPYQSAAGTTAMLANGSLSQVLTSAGGTSAPTFTALPTAAPELLNLGLSTAQSSGMVVSLKQSDASTNPSTGAGAVSIGMRSATLGSGAYNIRSITAALSVTIPTTATLGVVANVATTLWVYAIDSDGAGTMKLGVSTVLYDDAVLQTARAASEVCTYNHNTAVWTGTGAHLNGTAYQMTAGTSLPTGYASGNTYFVINQSGSTFKLSTTVGGAAVTAATNDGTGTITLFIKDGQLASDALYSAVPIRLIGQAVITLATAGVWNADPTSLTPGGKVLATRQYKAPTVQRFTSGSGTYILTSPDILYLKVRMVGGGGGGSNSGTAGGSTNGGNGGDTTFGDGTAAKGIGGAFSSSGGAGGGASLGTGWVGLGVTGGQGGGYFQNTTLNATFLAGAYGGDAPFYGGGGKGGVGNSQGSSGTTNTGGGGQGGGTAANAADFTGTGGGSGAFIEAVIPTPSTTYAYAVGGAGAASTGPTNGFVGGAGAAGQIEVWEYYQ